MATKPLFLAFTAALGSGGCATATPMLEEPAYVHEMPAALGARSLKGEFRAAMLPIAGVEAMSRAGAALRPAGAEHALWHGSAFIASRRSMERARPDPRASHIDVTVPPGARAAASGGALDPRLTSLVDAYCAGVIDLPLEDWQRMISAYVDASVRAQIQDATLRCALAK